MRDAYLPQILSLLATGAVCTGFSVSGYLHGIESAQLGGLSLTYPAALRKIPLSILGSGFCIAAWTLSQDRKEYQRQYREWEKHYLQRRQYQSEIATQADLQAYQQVAQLQAAERYYPQMAPYLDAEYQEVSPQQPQNQQPTQPDRVEKPTANNQPSTSQQSNNSTPTQSDTISIYLGQSANAEPVYWQPGQQSNGFIMLLGASGSGKTEALKVLAAEMDYQSIPVLMFDFHGDLYLQGAMDIVLSANSPYGINPLSLDSSDPNDGGVFAHCQILLNTLSRAIPSLGHRQRRVLDEALAAVYKNAGITDTDPTTWKKPAPTFADVINLLRVQAEMGDPNRRGVIESCIDAVAAIFGHPVFNKPNQIKIEAFLTHSHRLNLVYLEDQTRQFIVGDTILRKLYRSLRSKGHIPVQPKSDRERYRIFVVIDESKILSTGGSKDDPQAVLNIGATEYRKYGLALGTASQITGHYSDEFKAQIACRLVLKPFDIQQARANAPDIGLMPEDIMELQGKGDGWFKLGNQAVQRIQIRPLHDRPHLAEKPVNPVVPQQAATVEPEPAVQPIQELVPEQPTIPPESTPKTQSDFLTQARSWLKDCWQAESPEREEVEAAAQDAELEGLKLNTKMLALYIKKKGEMAVREVKRNWGYSYGLNAEEVDELLIELMQRNLIETFSPDTSRAEWVRWHSSG